MSKIFASPWSGYELIDAGNGIKLERWGHIITIRPDVNAYFKPELTIQEWRKIAHAEFVESSKTKGDWQFHQKIDRTWLIEYKTLKFNLRFTPFKHLGLFPEQSFNWLSMKDTIKPDSKVLNLFGYTGASSLMAKSLGADVFHIDSIKTVNEWGKMNMESSGLKDIHWVTEDALKFAKREIKRGHSYDLILMDPPAFGLGPNKKRWKIETEYKALINSALELLHPKGTIILNTYSPKLDDQKIAAHLETLNNLSNYSIDTLCIKTKYGKRLEFGLRTFIKK